MSALKKLEANLSARGPGSDSPAASPEAGADDGASRKESHPSATEPSHASSASSAVSTTPPVSVLLAPTSSSVPSTKADVKPCVAAAAAMLKLRKASKNPGSMHNPLALRNNNNITTVKGHNRVLSEDKDINIDTALAGCASSCQLFRIFEVMAAEQDVPVDVEVDEETEGKDTKDAAEEVEIGQWQPEGPPIDNDEMVEEAAEEDAALPTSRPGFKRTPTLNDTQHGRWLQAENEDVSTKLAALSMNALSSPYADSGASSIVSARRPSYRPTHLYGSDSEDETASAAASTAPTSEQPSTPTTAKMKSLDPIQAGEAAELDRFIRSEYGEAEKLQAIVDEFGDIASMMVNADGTPSEPESILAESQGALFKGVMMIGNLHLTTHRLLFHALLPPDSAFLPSHAMHDQTDEGVVTRPNIIRAGPITVHRSSIYKAKQRVWMELSPEMITTYPSGEEKSRVRPLFSILLSTILRLAPFDEDHPTDFYITYDSADGERTYNFTVDNEQSAITWRRYFEGALFRYSRQRFRDTHKRDGMPPGPPGGEGVPESEGWTMLRCCVPLDRAVMSGTSEYHSFATLVKMLIKLDMDSHVTWHPEEIAEGNYAAYGKTRSQSAEFEGATLRSSATDDSTKSKRSSRFLPSLPSSLRSRSRESSRDRASNEKEKRGSDQFSSPLRAETFPAADSPRSSQEGNVTRSRTYMDSTPPPCLDTMPTRSKTTYMDANPPIKMKDSSALPWEDVDDDGHPSDLFDFIVGVLNEQSWFVQVLEPAIEAAHERRYKEGVEPAQFILDVGGYDCLAKDDDIEARRDKSKPDGGESSEASSVLDDDEEAGRPKALIDARKREKAIMAAKVFGLREDEGIWLKRCYIGKVAPKRGHIILTPRYFCFWRRASLGNDIKYRYALSDIKGAEVASTARIKVSAMNVKINGQHDLHFGFWSKDARDETLERINEMVRLYAPGTGVATPTEGQMPLSSNSELVHTVSHGSAGPITLNAAEEESHQQGLGPVQRWQQVRGMKLEDKDFSFNPAMVADGTAETIKHAAEVLAPPPDLLLYPKAMTDEALSYMPFVANRPWQARTGWNIRLTSRRFVMLTIGSRGDVQPYIALALRLMEDGHKCVIVTHDEFKTWIEGYGIEHRQAGGDPTALMKLSTDHAMFSPGFFKEALGGFRKWLDELLVDSWNACQDADVLIESPSAMAGVHIAEGLAKKHGKPVPYFRAFTMPWTRTSAYPQAFMVPQIEMGPSFNYSTYVLFENIIWAASSGQINRWRKKYLGLKSTDQERMTISKVPFLYNFSPAVVPKPLDWDDDINITGYWNLENSDMDWSPPASLEAFMTKAKADGRPLVYIGFGSIIVPDPAAVTKSIVKGVEKSGVRAIIAKGWSARDAKGTSTDDEPFPPSCYAVDKVPHSWLFPKIQAAMHHGGAGTTGASLRAGIPTLIKPWFGDQHFWAARVSKLGVGAKVSSLRSDDIADALTKATTSTVMIEKAARIGERIRAESGVDSAVQAIHYNIIRAARNRQRLRKQDTDHASGRATTPGGKARPGTLPLSK